MLYRAIGLMSGSSLDGLDIAYVELHESGGKWTYEIQEAACYPYPQDWVNRLRDAVKLSAFDYQLLHSEYGHYLGHAVNRFIEEHDLHFKVALISSHGHTTFHVPARGMTAQLGDGAALAAETQLPVVTDLRAMDVALGGQGAPIVPVGERLLLGSYDYFLNLGGIANLSANRDPYIAFDCCPANRVLNLLSQLTGQEYDAGGALAATGHTDQPLLQKLNDLPFYQQPWPRSLANDFGTDIVFPLICEAKLAVADALCTYTEHIAWQISRSVAALQRGESATRKLLITGGGAFNTFLVQRISTLLQPLNVEVVLPEPRLIEYKEALIMALAGVLRWREDNNVFASVTGAGRDSVGGALWIGKS
jgi:anhydro-N-acetylmuramic acid kinase